MPYFTVNKKAQSVSGDHELHDLASSQGCLPDAPNRADLGWFASCRDAVIEARRHFADVNGCYYCANNCNTT